MDGLDVQADSHTYEAFFWSIQTNFLWKLSPWIFFASVKQAVAGCVEEIALFFEIAWNTRHLIATQFMPFTNNTTDDPPEGARWASTQKILLSMCLHELEPHASASSGPAAPGVLLVACHQCVQCVWNTLKLWIKTFRILSMWMWAFDLSLT